MNGDVEHLHHFFGFICLYVVGGIVQDVKELAENAADFGERKHLLLGKLLQHHPFSVKSAQESHLILDNSECLVVGNKSVRASNINSLGAFGGTHRPAEDKATHMEVSWRNQFLDNEIVVGNAWGGGQTEADRWLGGETALQIHGFARYYDYGLNRILYQSPEWVAAALGEDKPRDINIALSRFQIVRRHIIHNNSSIRIRGVVADVVVEHCRIAHSQRGIRVDMETQVDYPKDLGMLFDFSPEPSDKNPMLPFSRPVGVLARRNHFDDVHKPYSGTALEHAKVED